MLSRCITHVKMIRHSSNMRSILHMSNAANTPPTTVNGPKVADEIENNEPLIFLNSKAAKWRAKDSRSGGPGRDMPWYQSYVISLSLATFLIYFCILREESDVDKGLTKTLYERIHGLEERQLIMSYKYNKKNGIDCTALEARLQEMGVEIE